MDAYIGTIELFAFNYAPVYWVLCDGATLSTSTYPNLYKLIKTTYGGDEDSYQLPNLLGTEPYPYMKYYISTVGEYPVL